MRSVQARQEESAREPTSLRVHIDRWRMEPHLGVRLAQMILTLYKSMATLTSRPFTRAVGMDSLGIRTTISVGLGATMTESGRSPSMLSGLRTRFR